MQTIHCKPLILNKLLISLAFVLVIAIVITILLFPQAQELIFPSSITLSSLSVLFILYLNKNELYTITISGDSLHLDFLNKSIFKRVPLQLKRHDVTLVPKESFSEIHLKNTMIAKVRESSMKPEEWQIVKNYFAE